MNKDLFTIVKNTIIFQKGRDYLGQILRLLLNYSISDKEKNNRLFLNKPILCNSYPKSGTHLLYQILSAFPNKRSYGTFLSIGGALNRLLYNDHQDLTFKLKKMYPGEIARGHIPFHPQIEELIRKHPIKHYFIYRDPRNIIISQLNYLMNMQKMNRLSYHLRNLKDKENRISFLINGNEEIDFPNFYKRFMPYYKWIGNDNTLSMKFEELKENSLVKIKDIVDYYYNDNIDDLLKDKIKIKMNKAINPKDSHTYRKKTSNWELEFSEKNKIEFKRVTGRLIVRLGYEKSNNW